MTNLPTLNRRSFLKTATAGALVGAAGTLGIEAYAPTYAEAQTTDTPHQALQRLLDGNKRYLDQRMTSFNKDMRIIRQHTEEKQEPFAGILSCADSRVPVEIVFDQAIGDVFVTRVAGNIAEPVTIASLEYGAAALGTKAIMVLGHASCGAVKATVDVKQVPGQISALYSYIYPAVEHANMNVDAASRQNAKNQAELLRDASPVLADLVKQGKLIIVAAFYDVKTGEVKLLEEVPAS